MADVVFLIRHGEVDAMWRRRYLGASDPGLSAAGRRQCEQLRAVACEVAVASPARRARESAAFLVAPVVVEPWLREIDFGYWEGRTFAEIQRIASADLVCRWAEAPETMVFPGGEAVAAFRMRIEAAWRAVAARPERRVAVVTHGGVISWLRRCLGGPERHPNRGEYVRVAKDESGVWHEE